MATPLEQYQQIQAMVQKEAREIATSVYKELGSQYGVPSVPVHDHDGVDSLQIPTENIPAFLPLPSTTGGVISSAMLNTQTLNNAVTSGQNNPANAFTFPLNIIYGYGVGVFSAFNGGDAPEGSVILFANGTTNGAQIFVRIQGGWRGVDLPLMA